MTEPAPKSDAIKRLIWPLRLTRLGMVAEHAVRAFWPVWSLVFVIFAALAFGAGSLVTPMVAWSALALAAVVLLVLVVLGLRRFKMPTHTEALERLDATMPGRPITTLLDTPAVGGSDATSRSIWATHVARMAARASTARAPQPNLQVSRNDPYALRYVGAVALAMALLFGGLSRVADVGDVSLGAGAATASSGPSWEGWVEPPIYTGLPSLYLNDIFAESFEAPIGSEITLRTYGAPGDITLRTDIGPLPEPDPEAYAQTVTMERGGVLAIDGPRGREWQVLVRPDQPPTVALDGEVEGEAPGSMRFGFVATDDYGVRSGTATLRLNLPEVDRRFGLAVDPEAREPVVLDLPMPFRGNRDEFREVLLEDLSEHPFANLPVTLTLTVTDDAGQIATVSYDVARLPGQRFFDPLANGIIELRRDLLWSRQNATRTARILRALTHRPEPALRSELLIPLRRSIQLLEGSIDMVSLETQEDVAQILWDTALELEFNDAGSALERLQRAQERLAEAMRQGASEEEIAELMQDMREAMQDYLQELADNTEFGDQTDQPDQGQQGEQVDLEEMLRRIEELMQQGRMAEAMALMQELQEMLENIQITQGEGGEGGPQTPGQEAMEDLQDTLRDQQELSDDAFQDLQDQFNPNRPNQQNGQQGEQQGQQQGNQPRGDQPGQQGETAGEGDGGEGGQNQGSLADRQEALRRQLEDQAGRLPGTGTDAGDEALNQLDGAGRAMEEAAEALERGDIAEALDLQSEAMEGLREGMTQLSEALAQEQGAEPGQGQAEGDMAESRPMQDPLGRQAGNNGAYGSNEDGMGGEAATRERARELLDLLRDRASEQQRPELERDYLRRLLDQF